MESERARGKGGRERGYERVWERWRDGEMSMPILPALEYVQEKRGEGRGGGGGMYERIYVKYSGHRCT